jgi:UDP-2,4-diacetamido-2,4,6-trideoxy-beta-L-altropyranose hydrolase
MSTPSTLLIRADSTTRIGTGHVMRCVALAQAWQDRGGEVLLLTAQLSPALQQRLEAQAIHLHSLAVAPGSPDDAARTIDLARQHDSAWVVTDGYHFDAAYQEQIKGAGLRLLSIDDYGTTSHYVADLVLNQNISATESLYANRAAATRLLLGTRYVLLRREFRDWRGWQREIPVCVRRVLVTLGGADPDNVTLKVIQALQQRDDAQQEAVVLVGASNPHYDALQHAARAGNRFISLQRNITNMPEMIARADMVISAGGSTCWELAFLGAPMITLVLADNQQPIAEHLHRQGGAHSLGWHTDVTASAIAEALQALAENPEARAEMSRKGRDLVDGRGAERVVQKMGYHALALRPVGEKDARLVWEWVQDPIVRAASFSSAPIPWEDHLRWFSNVLADPQRIMYMLTNAQEDLLGQIRFDLEEHDATVSISLAPHARGYGYGRIALHLSTQELFATTPIKQVHAYVKCENTPSVRTFLQAGFAREEITTIQGHEAYHFVLTKDHAEANHYL